MVESSRSSASPKRPSCDVLWMLMTPIAWSPAMIGTPSHERAGVPWPRSPSSVPVGRPVEEHRPPPLEDLRGEALAEGQRLLSRVLAALDVVRELDHARSSSTRATYAMSALKASLRLVAHQLEQWLKVELSGERLADAVDRAELADAAAGSRR